MQGKVILITGGATGIGLAIVEKLFQSNTIISFDRKESNVERLHRRFGGRVTCMKVDINDHEHCLRAIDSLQAEFKRIDIFISNAGKGAKMDFSSISEAVLASSLHEEMMTNYLTPALMCKRMMPLLEKSPDPVIVLTTSGLAYMPIAQFAGYCASKAAAHSFAMSLRQQLKQTKIRVVETLPPTVDTNFNKDIDAPKISPEQYADQFLKALANGHETIRIGQSFALEKFSRLMPGVAFRMLNKAS